MKEQERINITFMYLYKNDGIAIHDGNIPELNEVIGFERIRSLKHIYEIGFADRGENKQRSMGSNTTVYSYFINSKGIDFVDTLPIEYSDRPFTFYMTLVTDEKANKKARDTLDDKLKEITLGNIKFNRYATLLSLFVAAIAIIVPVFLKNKSEKEILRIESTMLLEKKLQETQQKEQDIIKTHLDSLQNKFK